MATAASAGGGNSEPEAARPASATERKNETVRKIMHTPSLRHLDSVSLLSGY